MSVKDKNKFTHVMAKRSDTQLLEIVTKLRNNYQLEAIEAAELEIKVRNLSPEQIELAKEQIKEKDNEMDIKANAPLQAYWKILTFILPGILNLIFAGTFKADGYNRRFNEAWKWTFYGFGFYLGLFILIFIYALI